MWFYLWIPIAIIFYTAVAIFSKWANDESDTWRWVIVLFALNCVGMWPLVAKYSKNLVFDGLLYDLLIFMTFYSVILLMGAGKGFTPVQWVACVMVVIGFIMLKVGGG